MNIDWFEIEERLAYLEDKPDCIPEDIREWTKFREQYENALDFIKNYKSRDFSHPDMTEEFLDEKLLEIGCLGYGYKKSIFEIIFDEKTDLMPELDWKTIENFALFFDWTISLSDTKIKHLLLPLPQHVGGDFWCDYNQLTSLEGAPQHVGGDFLCDHNKLTTLEGAPQHVGRKFYCSDNQLTSLAGAPQHVGGDFYCPGNQLPKSIPSMFPSRDLHKYINIKESIILSFKDFKKL